MTAPYRVTTYRNAQGTRVRFYMVPDHNIPPDKDVAFPGCSGCVLAPEGSDYKGIRCCDIASGVCDKTVLVPATMAGLAMIVAVKLGG